MSDDETDEPDPCGTTACSRWAVLRVWLRDGTGEESILYCAQCYKAFENGTRFDSDAVTWAVHDPDRFPEWFEQEIAYADPDQ